MQMLENRKEPSQIDQFEEEESDNDDNSSQSEFSISAFPENVHLKPSFQGVFSHFTVYITNPFSTPQNIDISLDPNSNFSISTNKITLQAGIVYSLIITFISDEVGTFSTDMVIHTEHNTITIPLNAKCVVSPLLFNDSEIVDFQFSMAKTTLKFNIANRSLKDSLHVLFDFDTAAFSINPPSINLPPFSTCPIEIKYDPNFHTNSIEQSHQSKDKKSKPSSFHHQQVPYFHIQCSESGDSLTIPLNIARPNTSGLIDFGMVPINNRKFKQIKVKDTINSTENDHFLSMAIYTEDIPELLPPFSYQLINESLEEEEEEEAGEGSYIRPERKNNEILFSFYSSEVGDFYDTVQFGPLKYSLHAQAVMQPFDVHFPDDATSLMQIKNTAKDRKSYWISFDENFDIKQSIKFSLEPDEFKQIDTSSLKSSYDSKRTSIFIRWRENDHKLTQEIPFPANDLEVNEDCVSFDLVYGQKKKKSVNITNKSAKSMEVQLTTDAPEFSLISDKKLILKPHSIQKVDIEFNPKSPRKIQGTLQVHTENSVRNVPLKTMSAIITSTNLINFLRINDNDTPNFVFSFCGPKSVQIKKPNWVVCDDFANSTEPITITCRKLPNSISCGYFELVANDSQSLSIPILAYRESSDISFTVIRPYVVRVENHGIRTAFVIFTKYNKKMMSNTDEEDSENDLFCDVTPQAAFIPFNRSVTFTFSEETQTVLIHSGDEIMRQILSYLNPDHFYSKAFEDIDLLRDEISSIDIIDSFDMNEFQNLFEQLLSIEKVNITKINTDTFTISASKVDFGEVGLYQRKEMKFWIENRKLKPIVLNISSNDDSLHFPSTVTLKSEQRFLLKLSLMSSVEKDINDILIIQDEDETTTKKVVLKGFVVDTAIKFEADALNFGVCEVGRISRGKLRLYNRKKERTIMTVSASPPFSCPQKQFAIEPGCFILLPIHFTPLIESPFQGKILFQPVNSHHFYIPVFGFALYDPQEQ